MPPSISIVIVVQNEERTIGAVLAAAKTLTDNIILVDSGSTDTTIEIAKNMGIHVYHQDWLGYAAQKNYALDLAKGSWILSLDADEIMTPQLVAEIKHVLEKPQYNGFKIPRILHIGKRAVKHGGFYPDAQLRLFANGKGRFQQRMVHESLLVTGSLQTLKHPILHMAYKNITEFEQALEKYAQLSVQEFLNSGYSKWKISPLNELVHPWWTFFYRLILRRGFLDGYLGLRLNLIYANYVRHKISYLRQACKKNNHN